MFPIVKCFNYFSWHTCDKTKNQKEISIEESNAGLEVKATSTGEVIEVDINEAYITNAILTYTESNTAYSTTNTVPHDYDYVTL